MLRVLIVLAVIAVALLRGGSLLGFARLQVRLAYLVLGSLLIQFLIFPIAGNSALPPAVVVSLYLLSMGMLAVWVWLNRHLPGIALIGAGVLMNLAAIAANGGYMPVDPDAAAYAGNLIAYGGDPIYNNSLASEHVWLWLLTDIFPVPAGIPFAHVYSLGDILLTTGIGVLCFRTMVARPAEITLKGGQDERTIATV